MNCNAQQMIGQTLFQFVDMAVAKVLAQPRYEIV